MRLPLISSVVCISASLLSCSPRTAKKEHASTRSDSVIVLSPEQFANAQITSGRVENREVPEIIKANGALDVPPQNLVSISAPLGGFIKYTELLQGMKVVKGQLLVTLEHADYIQLQQDFLDADSQLEYLRLEYERQRELAKDSVNSGKSLQLSRSNYQSARARTDGLAAKLKLININIEDVKAGRLSSSINLYAPIAGFITQVNVNIGMHVSANDVIFRIVDNSHLHAEAQVFESDISRLRIGEKVRFTLSNDSVERTAHVYLIGKEITQDRTVRVHCHLDQEDPTLIPGMYFRARIEVPGVVAPALPEKAIVNFDSKNYVFVVLNDSLHHYQMVEIKKGSTQDGFTSVVVPASLPPNAAVVVTGTYELLSFLKNKDE